MVRFIKKNRALSICFCFSFSFCIFFILKLNSKEEFNYAYNWLNSLFQLSIGFIINFIFFITQIYIPQYRNDREANRCIGVRIDGIVNHMGELLSQLGTMYMGEYDEDRATSEYWLDVLRQINTNDRVGVLKAERLHSTSPNEESYFTVKEWIISRVEFVESDADKLMRYYAPYINANLMKTIEHILQSPIHQNLARSMLKLPPGISFSDINGDIFLNSYYALMRDLKKMSAQYKK